MPTTGNLSQPFQMPQMTPPPQVQVETAADKTQQQQAQMPPVYYGGKAGSAAFLADKVLTGWLAGRKISQERAAKKMSDEVGAAKTGLDYIGQAYRAAVESGDEKRIAETKSALSEAYNDYLNKAEKYAIPEEDGKKKTTGGKIKEGLKRAVKGGDDPHLNIAHSTLDIMRKTDPTQLYGPSKQETQQAELLDMQTREMKKDVANKDRWEKIVQADPSTISAGDKKFQEFYEYEHFGKTKTQQMQDQLLDKVASGGQLSDQERQLAETWGYVKPKVVSTQLRTIQDKSGNPVTQLVSIGPDGKLVGTQELPGKDYVGPNQAQLAGQVINAQMSALMKWGARMHPEWDPKTPDGQKALTTWALTTLYPPTAGTINWADQNAKMDTMNRAINAVIQKHTSKHKDPETGQEQQVYDQLGNAILGNVVTTTDDGRYAYMPSLPPGQQSGGSKWYNPFSWGDKPSESFGGMTREQLNDQERKFQAELRAVLKQQNPKMTDSQIDSMVPQLLSRQQSAAQGPAQAQAMTPPPTTSTAEQTAMSRGAMGVFPAPPAPQGQSWYVISMPDGSRPIRAMSPEYVEALQSRGIQVRQVGQ